MTDLQKYRRIFVNTWAINSPWKKKTLELSMNDENKYRFLFMESNSWMRNKNHPLVNSGLAYWMNNKTLCLGYILKTNESIVRPIFSHKRHELITVIHDEVKEAVLNRMNRMIANAHESKMKAYVECFKIEKWPKVILDKIFELVYYDYWVNDNKISKLSENMKILN